MQFILVGLLAAHVVASAQPSLRQICERPLSFRVRYAKLAKNYPSPDKSSVWLTKLIDHAFTPGMLRVRREVLAKSASELRAVARKAARWKHEFLLDPPEYPPTEGERPYDGCASWEPGFFIRDLGSRGPLMAPWVPSNRREVSRLTRAAKVVLHYAHALDSPFTGDHEFLERHSFTKTDFHLALHVGALTTLQAISYLSANPIESLSTEDLVRQITARKPHRPSLVVQMALLAPPLFMGHVAGRVTRADVLNGPSDDLDLSPSLRAKLDAARARWKKKPDKPPFEFGHGCPVAHLIPGETESALQSFVDTIVHVRDALGDKRPGRPWW